MNRFSRKLCSLGVTGLLAAVSIASFAPRSLAQDPTRTKEAPASASSGNRKPSKPKNGSQKQPTQRAISDAILASTLGMLVDQSGEHFHHGEYDHCIALCRYIVQGDPKNLDAYSNAAYLLWSTDRFDEGTALLKQGLNVNPNTYWMYDELGTHFSTRKRDYKTALGWYEQAVKFPCPYPTYHGLAVCYEHLGRWNDALKAWEKAATYKDDVLAPARVKRIKQRLGIKA